MQLRTMCLILIRGNLITRNSYRKLLLVNSCFSFDFWMKEDRRKRKISFNSNLLDNLFGQWEINGTFPGFMTAAFLVDGSLTGGKDRSSPYSQPLTMMKNRLPKKSTVAVWRTKTGQNPYFNRVFLAYQTNTDLYSLPVAHESSDSWTTHVLSGPRLYGSTDLSFGGIRTYFIHANGRKVYWYFATLIMSTRAGQRVVHSLL